MLYYEVLLMLRAFATVRAFDQCLVVMNRLTVVAILCNTLLMAFQICFNMKYHTSFAFSVWYVP